jgi:hypothetical protein
MEDGMPTHARVFAHAVTRISDGRRFYFVELGGSPDEPGHMSLVDRDEERRCDGCGIPFIEHEHVLGIHTVGIFHPDCAPRPDEL